MPPGDVIDGWPRRIELRLGNNDRIAPLAGTDNIEYLPAAVNHAFCRYSQTWVLKKFEVQG